MGTWTPWKMNVEPKNRQFFVLKGNIIFQTLILNGIPRHPVIPHVRIGVNEPTKHLLFEGF